MEYQTAKAGDLSNIKKLLSAMDLPLADIAGHLDGFIVARAGREIVGVVGMELTERIVCCDRWPWILNLEAGGSLINYSSTSLCPLRTVGRIVCIY